MGVPAVVNQGGGVSVPSAVLGVGTDIVKNTNPLPVGGFMLDSNGILQTNPTVTASAYSANNEVGGIQTLSGVSRVAGGKAILDSISVYDASGQGAQLSLYFFKGNPAGGTYADHGAVTQNSTDYPLFLGGASLLAANYVALGAGKVVTLTGIGLQLTSDASNNVYVVATTTGTPTYTALCLFFNYGIRQG